MSAQERISPRCPGAPLDTCLAPHTVEDDEPRVERDDAADSDDDDDDDDPLRGMEPLPKLQAAPDTCDDLRLAQPPAHLRSAYEMLVGPAKEPSPSAESWVCLGGGATSEM